MNTWGADLGIHYNDLANREPLLTYLTRFAMRVLSKQLDAFIRQHNISITNKHIVAAKTGHANDDVLAILPSCHLATPKRRLSIRKAILTIILLMGSYPLAGAKRDDKCKAFRIVNVI